ncbi:MAG: thiol reductant ABC exporter subunit CydC [Wenzhouxiangellaceae bacterium]|nr:thiol reductant ABC exporter subunit CydC [Wenzhouxiangellaceae bacterium]
MRLRRLLLAGTGVRRRLLPVAAAALAALAAVGFALLLLGLAGWLITASALAGIGVLAVLDVFAPGAGIRAAAVGRTGARYLERLIGHEATFRQLARVRTAAFAHLLALPVAALEALRKGDALNRLTRDIDTLDHFIPRLLLPSVAAAGATLAVFAWLLLWQPAAAWIVAGAFGFATLAVLVPGALAARGPGSKLALARPRMRVRLNEWLGGLAELVSLDRAAERAGQVLAPARQQVMALRAQRRIEALMQGGIQAAGYAGFWLVLLFGLERYAAGGIGAPALAAVALVMLALIESWPPLAASWSFFETLRRAAVRVDAPGDPPRFAFVGLAGGRDRIPRQVVLEARGVGFRFGGSGPLLIDGLDLALAPGERVAIAGPSGCGKSTLARLLAGVYAPDRGRVELDGRPLDEYDERALRRHIGLMPQQPMLFNDTLAANLRLAAPEAEDARLVDVLRQVELASLLDSLPHGLDSWVGEHGRAVSGGEARRIALARMLLADFPVLILDEPTAGIDPASARRIRDRIEPALAGKTVVMLSHDSETLPHFDRRLTMAFRRA